jgi:hypothetical protein
MLLVFMASFTCGDEHFFVITPLYHRDDKEPAVTASPVMTKSRNAS